LKVSRSPKPTANQPIVVPYGGWLQVAVGCGQHPAAAQITRNAQSAKRAWRRETMCYHEEYRKLWVNSGYPGDMGSACAVKPPPKEFRPAYHFTEVDHAISNIENARMKVTRILETNDPFELAGLNAAHPRVRREIEKFKNENDKNLRLLCFSKDWRSPALWAHYANRHMGICLGFWAKPETLLDVTYHRDRIDAGFTSAAPVVFTPKIKELLITAKARDWYYEEEIRRCVPLAQTFESMGIRFYHFDETLKLREVILGAKCTTKIDDVCALVRTKYKDVAVYKARPAFGYFKMVPHESTIPK